MASERVAVGVADRLGYLWCADCLRAAGILELNPEIVDVVWAYKPPTDRRPWGPHGQEPCDFCRRQLDEVSPMQTTSRVPAVLPCGRAGRPGVDSTVPAGGP